jgi:hypothetical protein
MVPLRDVLIRTLHDDTGNHLGNIHPVGRNAWNATVEHRSHNLNGGIALENRSLGEQRPQQDSQRINIRTYIRLSGHAASLLRADVEKPVLGTELVGYGGPLGVLETVFERSLPGTESNELHLLRFKVEMEGVAPDFTMDDALSVMDHLQALTCSHGKLQKLLQADGRIEWLLVLATFPFVTGLPSRVERGAQVDETGNMVVPRELVYGHHQRSTVSGHRGEMNKLDRFGDVVPVSIGRRHEAFRNMKAALFAENIV